MTRASRHRYSCRSKDMIMCWESEDEPPKSGTLGRRRRNSIETCPRQYMYVLTWSLNIHMYFWILFIFSARSNAHPRLIQILNDRLLLLFTPPYSSEHVRSTFSSTLIGPTASNANLIFEAPIKVDVCRRETRPVMWSSQCHLNRKKRRREESEGEYEVLMDMAHIQLSPPKLDQTFPRWHWT